MPPRDPAAEAAALVERRLRHSVDVVTRWGAVRTSAGLTIAETLNIDGIAWWDIGAVDLALYRVPPLLASDGGRGVTVTRARRRISRWQQLMRRPWRAPARPTPEALSPNGALCVAFSPYMTRDVVRPVADALARRHGPTPMLLTTTATVSDGAIAERTLDAYWDDAAREDAMRLRAGLAAVAREVLSRASRDGIARATPAVDSARAMDILSWFVHSLLPSLVVGVACARRVIALETPLVVVTTDGADPRSRGVTLLARRIGTPTFELQFGACGGEATEWSFALGDRIGVWGAQAKGTLESHGVAPQRIVVTGSPRYDRYARLDGNSLRSSWGVTAGERVVLFVSTYHIAAYEESVGRGVLPAMRRAVVAAAAATPGVLLVVKPHPLERGIWRDMPAGVRIVIADPAEDVRPLVAAADAVVTLGSTVTLDALVAGKAVICPEFHGWPYSVLFTRTGAVDVPTGEPELLATFRSVAADGGNRLRHVHRDAADRFVRHWLKDNTGRASEDIAELIGACAREGRHATITTTISAT